MPHAGGRRRHKADRAAVHSDVPPDTLLLQLTLSTTHLQQLQLQGRNMTEPSSRRSAPLATTLRLCRPCTHSCALLLTQMTHAADCPVPLGTQQQEPGQQQLVTQAQGGVNQPQPQQDASDQQQVALQLVSYFSLFSAQHCSKSDPKVHQQAPYGPRRHVCELKCVACRSPGLSCLPCWHGSAVQCCSCNILPS